MSTAPASAVLRNPQLEGESFFWKAGPVGVLLLHGLTSTTAEMRPFARFLQAQGYTTAGPLLPGHGTTPEDLNQQKWTDWAASADDAYQYLAASCKTVFVAGASMGGLLALYLASKQPEIKGLLLFAPALRVRNAKYAYLVSLFVASIRKQAIHEEMPWQGYYVNPTGAAAQLYRLQREIQRQLKAITQPVVIFQGQADRTIEPESSQLVYDLIQSKQKELHWINQASHVVLLDRDAQIAQTLSLEFIKKTEGD